MDSRHISAEYAWGKKNNFILNQKSDSNPLTCLITKVPSLEGVVAWSLSESSTLVLADSVSPLLSFLEKTSIYETQSCMTASESRRVTLRDYE